MLNYRTGYWMEAGRNCELCEESWGDGEPQTVEHLLEGCKGTEQWWKEMEEEAGWLLLREKGNWKTRLLPEGDLWKGTSFTATTQSAS